MIKQLWELGEDPTEVGMAIVFDDGATFVRRYDMEETARLFDTLDHAKRVHNDHQWKRIWAMPWEPGKVPKVPSPITAEETQKATEGAMHAVTGELLGMLIEKNRAYGNSALEPTRIFSKASALEGVRVRIDDKLSRLQRGHEYPGDDTIKDLAGYLIIYLVGKRLGIA